MTLDLTNQRFGKLVALHPCGKDAKAGIIWKCNCDCGVETTAMARQLKAGSKKSCGCLRFEASGRPLKHGMKGAPEWISWQAMRQRCRHRHSYKKRGLKVCKRWESFERFYEDMGARPKGRTLGRINNNKGYFPSNCRWETPKQQARNRIDSVVLDNGMNLAEFCEKTGVNRERIKSYLQRGAKFDATGTPA